jgi:pseudouridine-5'-phosphate glycosidase
MHPLTDYLFISDEVRAAAREGLVVALETSVVAQGLPAPHNLAVAQRCAEAVRAAGAVPATVAVIGGRLVIGADQEMLERLADPAKRPAKAGARDLGPLLAAGRDAGTTVSATCLAASLAGIRLFATGGIGGVHRRGAPAAGAEPLDVSADLAELARRPVCVVSAGPKAILDVPATAEALEALGVPVIGWGTSELPAFYVTESGVRLEHRVEDAAAAARLLQLHWGLGQQTGVLLAVPPPKALPRAEIEAALAPALAEATARKLPGKEVTPFLLGAVARATSGRTLEANVALLVENARVAGLVAAAWAQLHSGKRLGFSAG